MAKRKRRANFSVDELEVLCNEVGQRKVALFDKFSDSISQEVKKKAWREISNRVSAVATVPRSSDDVRKKWTDWASIVKGKAAKVKRGQRKTGGGTDDSPKLTQLEERVAAIIGPIAIGGVPGGIDSGAVGGTETWEEDGQSDEEGQSDLELVEEQSEDEERSQLAGRTSCDTASSSGTVNTQSVDLYCNEDVDFENENQSSSHQPSPHQSSSHQTQSSSNTSSSHQLSLHQPRQKSPRIPPVKKRRVSSNCVAQAEETELVNIEKQKLQLKKEKIEIEKMRLQIEREQLLSLQKTNSLLEQIVACYTTPTTPQRDDDHYSLTDL
jgi:hypothetical protein